MKKVRELTYQDLLEEFFHSKSPFTIEVRVNPENTQEIAFALKSASKPFALIRIGDIGNWLKEKLTGYDVVEKYEKEESYFRYLNQSDINLLMGSRAFYEG